ncbi:MAG: translation elongation factor Ts [Armatimonadetes bacterium]|nr:translation elongation factor Ts [Anaerolineae bacterium]
MADITAKMVKDLRESTGAGPLDCKKALETNGGDLQKAVDWLREKGIAKAAKKLGAGRVMNEGLIEHYMHFNRRLGVLVEINCETDFVAATSAFQTFVKDVALHIANMAPQYIRRSEIPQDVIDAEKNIQLRILKEDPKNANKPDEILERIIEGRMDKFYAELVLMEQPSLKDDDKTIEQLLQETVAAVGESIEIRRFARFALGERSGSDVTAQDS